MALLNVWTKPAGFNLGYLPSYGFLTTVGSFIVGKTYNISAVGSVATDFTLLGSDSNTVGTLFTATKSGITKASELITGRTYIIASIGTSEFTAVGASSNTVGTVFVATHSTTGTGTVVQGNGSATQTWINERTKFNNLLPVENDTGVSYAVISGALPTGLRIQNNYIVGTPFEVPRTTEFSFCIRASKGLDFADRTYYLTVEGADDPTFVTPPGNLNIGVYQQYFAMDSSYIDYQIEAFDLDTATGQTLSYFIADDEGKLPPGLVLTNDGRIVGFIQPALSIKPEDGTGTYDNSYFDAVAYDFAYRPTNGYDSYIFDTVFYDFALLANAPKKLNRNYEFIITITDGDSIVKRKFKIFVVGDDYFRADNTTWLNGNGLFTADVSYLRAPIWLTAANLGTYRANNYITVLLDIYDTDQIRYTIDNVNNLPPGMSFDAASGEIYGTVPYQAAVTKTYTFTVTASRYGDHLEIAETSRTFTIRIVGEVDSVIKWVTDSNLGSINANFISILSVEATSTIPNAIVLYQVTEGKLPPGLSLDLDGEIVGKLNQYGDGTCYKSLWKANRTYNLNDVVSYNNKSYKAIITNSSTIFNPNQWIAHSFTASGLTLLDNKSFTFDGGTTSIDRKYKFTIEARDQFSYSAISRTFTIDVVTPNKLVFSNIRTKPFLSLAQRSSWEDFINNTSIFTPECVYRPNDPSFGLQSELSMIIYAGIETTDPAVYISSMGLNHKRKRFHFGNIKKAVAVRPGTTDQIYEVVYIEMLDPLEPNGKKLPNRLENNSLQPNKISTDSSTSFWSRSISDLSVAAPTAVRPEPILTVDSTGYQVSNPKANAYFPNSISNWRERLKASTKRDGLALTQLAKERNYLPLWMRSIQPGGKQELGFTLAVPICFCKLGTADDIILNIKYSGFSFNTLDYTTDRYIIDSVEGETGDKYLVFRNDRITV